MPDAGGRAAVSRAAGSMRRALRRTSQIHTSVLAGGEVRAVWVSREPGNVDVATAKAQLLRAALAAPAINGSTVTAQRKEPATSEPLPRGEADTAAVAVPVDVFMVHKRPPRLLDGARYACGALLWSLSLLPHALPLPHSAWSLTPALEPTCAP